jgi:hypothetical protein
MIKHGKKSLLILDALSKTSFAKHARTSPTAPHRTPPHPTNKKGKGKEKRSQTLLLLLLLYISLMDLCSLIDLLTSL